MIDALKNAWRLPDLRYKILFTLGIIVVYRFGAHIPTPGIPVGAVRSLFEAGGLLGFLDLFAGGALSEFAVFALGIMPYITASIVMQLMTLLIPKVEEWAKEGETGQRKITQWTRYLTLVLAFSQSLGMTYYIQKSLNIPMPLINRVVIITTLVSGTALVMWLGELITQRGVGNGMSLLIFISIISRFPDAMIRTFQVGPYYLVLLTIAVIVVMFMAIIYVELGQRRIPVQYAKRVVGRRVYGGASTYLPIKVNSAGVIPIIFAAAFLVFPTTIAKFFPSERVSEFASYIEPGSAIYLILYFILIVVFTFFYAELVFNPVNIADNLKKWGGFIPGIRPGMPTAEYINRVLTRITFPGAIFIAIIAIVPMILLRTLNDPFFKNFGGTSILILVGVALETSKQIEAQLLMRHYEGFIT